MSYDFSKLKQKTEEILSGDPLAKILIMGDFNDYPDNKSVYDVLNSRSPKDAGHTGLYNLVYDLHLAGKGSHNHRGHWGMLDQFIVSRGLLGDAQGYCIKANSVAIFNPRWILYKNKNTGQNLPNRTFSGKRYHGGYSDHLPITLEFKN